MGILDALNETLKEVVRGQSFKQGFEDGKNGTVDNMPIIASSVRRESYKEGFKAGQKAVPTSSANKIIITED